jgi:glycosyltransferase involved in cell wall biosynthesis
MTTSERAARIAVIIPCFNDGPLLREALGSIVEDEPVEIVVVDDHSTEPATISLLEELRAEGVQIESHDRNAGVAAARGTGVRATEAALVFPLDADDLAVPGALGAMADRLDAEPEAVACFGDYEEFGDRELVRAVPPMLDPFRIAFTNEYPVTAMFRRDALEAVGGWNGNGYAGSGYEDWNLWMTLAERSERCVHLGVGRLTYRRRLHGERKLAVSKRQHPQLYAELRRLHPGLFARIDQHRRESDLGRFRKRLYPLVYGGRRRYRFEPRVKNALDRLGIWTLRR